MDDSLSITIGKAEALVLFDLLFDFRDQPHVSIRNGAERVVLWMLEACLEKELANRSATTIALLKKRVGPCWQSGVRPSPQKMAVFKKPARQINRSAASVSTEAIMSLQA